MTRSIFMNVKLFTLGCKLNYAETSTIAKSFVDKGFKITEQNEKCDVFVINSCSVTERADRECRQIIRKVLRKSPNAFVAVTGCYAQLCPEEIASIEGVDLVLGAKDKFKIFDFENNFSKYQNPKIQISTIDELNDFNSSFTQSTDSRTRAFLKIQDGCDYNCSFCTIPLARGKSRSQEIEKIIVEAKKIVENGFKEIVLIGVNVGDFGKKNNSSLLNLLKELVKIENLERIRISSIEPNLLNDELLDFWLSHNKICKHFHIPLQSGSDKILRMMKRRYTSEDYKNLVNKIKQRNPNAAIGVDVIVGFPNEDEIEFQKTYDFLRDLEVSYLHVFTYSERENTPSVNYANRIEPRIRFNHSERLRMLGLKLKRNFHEKQFDNFQYILLESVDDKNQISGHADNYIKIKMDYIQGIENTIQKVKINKIEDDYCFAELIEEEIIA